MAIVGHLVQHRKPVINMELLCLSLKQKKTKKNGIVERARDNVGAN